MDHIGLRHRKRRLGIDTHHVIEERKWLFGKARAGSAESFGCIGKLCRNRLIEVPEREPLWDAEPQSLERRRFERPGIIAGHYRIGGGARRDALRDRPD